MQSIDFEVARAAFDFVGERRLPELVLLRDVEAIGVSAIALDGSGGRVSLAWALDMFSDFRLDSISTEAALAAVYEEHGEGCFDALSRGYFRAMVSQ